MIACLSDFLETGGRDQMKKILVIGCSGTGKSTLAKLIAKKTTLPYSATDSFYWEADWQLTTTEAVVEKVDAATQKDAWILDGNFDAQRDFVWQRADLIIWLDYPLRQVALQIMKRNLGWYLSQKTTWSGNRMTWRRAWSGIRHALKSHALKRRTYPKYLEDFPHLRFCSSAETDRWLATLHS